MQFKGRFTSCDRHAAYFPRIFKFKLMQRGFRMQIFLIIPIAFVTTTAYHRDWGPILPPFTPGYVKIVTVCVETENHACLELPPKEFCVKKMSGTFNALFPLPWWYFYCQLLVSPKWRTTMKTTSYTVHRYYKDVLEEVKRYKEGLTKSTGAII